MERTMAHLETLKVPMPKVTLGIRIYVPRAVRFRFWLGCGLIKLGARVLGDRAHVEFEGSEPS